MNKLEYLTSVKQYIEKTNPKLFEGEVLISTRKGNIKWVASQDSFNVILSNLKRTTLSKFHLTEIEKLMESITNNKFILQFKQFANFYNNTRFGAEDINIGQCPRLKKLIPTNKHYHNKKYFITLIIDWYISYYEWVEKINLLKLKENTTKALMQSDLKKEETNVDEIPEKWENTDHPEFNEEEREIPDSWDD